VVFPPFLPPLPLSSNLNIQKTSLILFPGIQQQGSAWRKTKQGSLVEDTIPASRERDAGTTIRGLYRNDGPAETNRTMHAAATDKLKGENLPIERNGIKGNQEPRTTHMSECAAQTCVAAASKSISNG
jgi:hypothetical protein